MANQDQPIPQVSYPCLCALIRKAGRVLTRKYDAWLKPSGLKVTQFSMLANIAHRPGLTVSALAQHLLMDQTTVTRNLGVLEKHGYIQVESEPEDHRSKQVHLSPLGRAKLTQARPLWAQAQKEVEDILGREGIYSLLDSSNKLLK